MKRLRIAWDCLLSYVIPGVEPPTKEQMEKLRVLLTKILEESRNG